MAAAADEVRTAYTANGSVNYVIDAETNRTTYVYDGFRPACRRRNIRVMTSGCEQQQCERL